MIRKGYSYRNCIEQLQPDGTIIWLKPDIKPKYKRSCYGNVSDIRKIIFERDGNKCYYCGSTKDLHMDHVMPKSIFRWHDVYNIITACHKCNFRKGTKLLLDPLLSKVLNYLIKANKRFSDETKINYQMRLTQYYEGNVLKN